MHHAVLRLCDVRIAVVLVDKNDLQDSLIADLQTLLAMPVMLVARDDASWRGVKARAQFDTEPYLFALMNMEAIEWSELPEMSEPELPF